MSSSHRQFITTKGLWWLTIATVAIAAGISVPYVDPIYTIIGILLIVNVFLIASYPTYGLLAYLAIFLYRPGEIYPSLAPLRIELVLGVLVITVLVIHQKLKTGKVTLPHDNITLSLAAFLGVMYLSIFTSYEQSVSIETCKEFLKILIFYFLIVSLVDNYKKFVAFMVVYIIMIGKIAYDAFYLYITGGFVHAQGIDRLVGTTSAGGDANAIAATLAITIPIVIATAFYARSFFIKFAMGGLGLGMTYLITITGSRGGMLALLGAMAGGFIYVRHKILALLMGATILIVGFLMLPPQYQERYLTMINVEDVNDTSSGRTDIWIAGIKMVAARPVLGVGAGAFRWAAASAEFGYGRFMQAHNLIIQITATTGFIGLFVWMMFFVNYGKRLRTLALESRESYHFRWADLYSKAFIASTIALFVAGGFGHNLYRYNWYIMAALTVAMTHIVRQQRNELKLTEVEENQPIEPDTDKSKGLIQS